MQDKRLALALGEDERFRHPHDARRVERAAAKRALLLSPRNEGRDADAASHPQQPRALGPAQFVRGERHGVCGSGQRLQVAAPARLHAVGKEERAVSVAQFRRLLDGLKNARFVVDRHERHELCTTFERLFDGLEGHPPLPIASKKSVLPPELRRREDGGVLDGGDGEGLARRKAAHRPVIRLGAARGEVHLFRLHPERPRNAVTRFADEIGSLPPEGVQRVGVAEIFFEEGEHALEHFRPQRRRCRVV